MTGKAPYEGAVEETAKTIGKAIDAGTRLGAFTARVFGSPLSEVAGWSHDYVRVKRLMWQAKNVDEVMTALEKLKASGVPLRAIPDRQASFLLDCIANEDNPDIQRLWVRLMDSATSSTGGDLKRLHMNVLRSIDPPEARILEALANFLAKKEPDVGVMFGGQIASEARLSEADATVHLHHLASLGCFMPGDKSVTFVAEPYTRQFTIEMRTADFQMTDLLASLLSALQLNQPAQSS